MFERITLVFKAMINALLGKVEDPQMMLDQTYAELQSELIKTREQLAVALATEAQLKVQIEKLERKNLPAEELKEKLKQVQAEIAKLRRKISDLENQVGRACTSLCRGQFATPACSEKLAQTRVPWKSFPRTGRIRKQLAKVFIVRRSGFVSLLLGPKFPSGHVISPQIFPGR